MDKIKELKETADKYPAVKQVLTMFHEVLDGKDERDIESGTGMSSLRCKEVLDMRIIVWEVIKNESN